MSDYNKPSKEELEAFWKGDDETRLRLYNERMQQKASAAEAAGKQITYSPPDNNLQEVTVTAKPQDKPNTGMSTNDMIDLGITAAGFVPGLDTAADIADVGNQLRQGNYGSALLSAGLAFIPGVSAPMVRKGLTWLRNGLGNIAESAGRGLFNHMPYKAINKAVGSVHKAKSFLTESPKTRLRNRLRARPQFMIDKIEDVPMPKGANSTEDAMELLKSRYQHRYDNSTYDQFDYTEPFNSYNRHPGAIYFEPANTVNLEDIEIHDYLPMKEVRRMAYGNSKKSSWADPILWFTTNYDPAFAEHSSGIVHINPAHLKAYGWNNKAQIQNIKAHEVNHNLRNIVQEHLSHFSPGAIPDYPDGFSYGHLKPMIQNYFKGGNNTELWARGTQLKNYFGLKGGEEITPDMLKYAAKHYVKDTRMDNNMIQFFSGIKDWNQAAKQLSEHSLKNGGIIKEKGGL